MRTEIAAAVLAGALMGGVAATIATVVYTRSAIGDTTKHVEFIDSRLSAVMDEVDRAEKRVDGEVAAEKHDLGMASIAIAKLELEMPMKHWYCPLPVTPQQAGVAPIAVPEAKDECTSDAENCARSEAGVNAGCYPTRFPWCLDVTGGGMRCFPGIIGCRDFATASARLLLRADEACRHPDANGR